MIDVRGLMGYSPFIAFMIGFACLVSNIWFSIDWLLWVGFGFCIVSIILSITGGSILRRRDEKDEDVYL